MISSPPRDSFDQEETPRKAWIEWTKTAWRTLKKDRGDGPTTGRPTNKLEVSHYYFDTTLGYTIYYNGSAWVDGTGTPV